MHIQLDGASRVHYIVGDPIAQVKSPAGVTQTFQARGHNALVVPAHVRSTDLQVWMEGVSRAQNVDGIIITVPHKFAFLSHCKTCSDRAAFLQAVNVMRRNCDGTWHGDMFDGLGYIEAMRSKGCEPKGQTALLVGAGGAGSAIAHSLITAGVRSLSIHDGDPSRRDALIARLSTLGLGDVQAAAVEPSTLSPSVAGFDIALNATPAGMKVDDALPFNLSHLKPSTFIGCVVTAPAIPPVIEQAQAQGCNTVTGAEMFVKVRDLMVDFLLAGSV